MKRFLIALALVLALPVVVNAQTFSARLDWIDNSNDEDYFPIQRSLNGSPFVVIGSSLVPFFDDNTLVAGQVDNVYTYRVAAYKLDGGLSAYSNQVSKTILANVPPPPPPTTPPAPSVVVTVLQCNAVITANPPNTTGGWTAQFRDGGANIGNPDNSAPFTTTRTIAAGNHTYTVRWTKGSQTLTSAATVKACP